ncbi:ATP-binding cassette sub-family G member 1 [Periplaneta americana]|uniref:ATP-binding cassette sub-family G member 1 n=1 Tax=Periplaneta americana TaxID=6978 RepID=UPI0037E74378
MSAINMKQSAQGSRKGLRETSCCLKTPSVSSMDNRFEETTLTNGIIVDSEELVTLVNPSKQGTNNNNKFHAENYQKIEYRFPKKLAVNIQFKDIFYRRRIWTLQQPIPVKKEILHGVNGEFRAGELTAIMGPSGAGKSTLLNILAGYKVRGVEGTVLVNGQDRDKEQRDSFSRMSCYILQDDDLRPALTVKEAMMFVAHLKLGYCTSHRQKHKQIFDLLEMLGLSEHANTRTGSLSGGQKKRLSIALELICNPPVLFLDEPTTGLDSSSCSQCVSLLKLLAQQGRTVVCTIHQPSALLFEMFDHLYAVADGNCIYQGSIQGLVPFLEDFGLKCPPYHNPADYLIEVAVGEYDADISVLAAEAAKNVSERRKRPAIKLTETANGDAIKTISDSQAKDEKSAKCATLASSENSSIEDIPDTACAQASLFAQFFLLYYRNILEEYRNYKYFLIRLLAHIVIGIVFGYLYKGVGSKATSVFGNFVYLYGSLLFLVYTGTMAVTATFPLQMNVLKREYFNQWYSLLPSFLATIFLEMPIQILGAIFYIILSYVSTEQPMELHRIALFFMIAFCATLTAQSCGFFIGVVAPLKIAVFFSPVVAVLMSNFGFNMFHRDIPEYFMWMYHISYFRASLHSLMTAMYGMNRTALLCEDLYCHYKYPKKFLEDVDIGEVDIKENTIFVVCFCVTLHVCTLVAIWVRLNRR